MLKPIGFDQNAMTTMSRRGNVVRKQADRTNAAFTPRLPELPAEAIGSQ